MRSRLAFLFVALPLCAYAYACSSDDAANPGPEDDAGAEPDTGSGDNDSGGGEKDSGQDANKPADAGDAATGDGGTCTINPLADAPDGGAVISGATLPAVVAGDFPDGPQYVDFAGGTLIFSQAFANRIVRIQGDGGGTIAPFRQTPNALPLGNVAAGDFIYTAQSPDTTAGTPAGPSILRTLVDGGPDASLAVGTAGSPNGIAVSPKGVLYFTDPPYQGGTSVIFRLDPKDGGLTTIEPPAINPPPPAIDPDGIAVSPDGTALYVSLSGAAPSVDNRATRRLIKYALDANGVASNPQLIPFAPTQLPVGLRVDTGGNIWIAEDAFDNAMSGRVEVITPAGKKWGEITFGDSRPTGVAFGGPDNKTVYITAERGVGTDGSLYMFTSRCAGIR